MKLKNKALNSIINGLSLMGDQASSIHDKWEIALLLKPYQDAAEMVQTQMNQIVNQYGTQTDDGSLSIKIDDPHVLELMECESDVPSIPLSKLETYHPDVSVLAMLVPAIDGEN